MFDGALTRWHPLRVREGASPPGEIGEGARWCSGHAAPPWAGPHQPSGRRRSRAQRGSVPRHPQAARWPRQDPGEPDEDCNPGARH
eukprot:3595431-Pyramimonas_sp.AAC.1